MHNLKRILVTTLILLPVSVFSQSKVGTEIGSILGLSPSVRSQGMGGVGVILSDNQSVYHNPAVVGLIPFKLFAFTFYPTNAKLGILDHWSTTISTGVERLLDNGRSILRIGLAYQHQEIKSPVFKETTYQFPGGTGRYFRLEDVSDRYTLALAYKSTIDVSVGATLNRLKLGTGTGSTKRIDNYDLGILIRLPLAERNGPAYGEWLGYSVTPTIGASWSGLGPDTTDNGDYLMIPGIRRLGFGLWLAYGDGTLDEVSLFPALQLTKVLKDERKTQVSLGAELGLLESVYLRTGLVSSGVGGTFGITLSTGGIQKQLPWAKSRRVTWKNPLKYLLRHLVVEFSYARLPNGSDSPGMYSIDVIL